MPLIDPAPIHAVEVQPSASSDTQPPLGVIRSVFKLPQFISKVTKELVPPLLHFYKRRPSAVTGANKKGLSLRRSARLACKPAAKLTMEEKAQDLLRRRLGVPTDNTHEYLQLFEGPLTEAAIRAISALVGFGVEDYRLPVTVVGPRG